MWSLTATHFSVEVNAHFVSDNLLEHSWYIGQDSIEKGLKIHSVKDGSETQTLDRQTVSNWP